jgi:hypothetical protein
MQLQLICPGTHHLEQLRITIHSLPCAMNDSSWFGSKFTLIGFPSLLFYPFLMIGLRTLATGILSISPSDNVIWSMFNTMHLFRPYDKVSFFVFVGEKLHTSLKKPEKKH